MASLSFCHKKRSNGESGSPGNSRSRVLALDFAESARFLGRSTYTGHLTFSKSQIFALKAKYRLT